MSDSEIPINHPAMAFGDDKLQPGEVPEAEFTGIVKDARTDGCHLLVFTVRDGDTAIGVRLDDEELKAMHRDVGSYVDLSDEAADEAGDGERGSA